MYAYAEGRALSVAYTNAAGYNVGYTITLPGGSVFRREVRRDPLHLDRILTCSNFFNTTRMIGYAYQYDILGRPVSRNSDTFAYDSCGQVTNMVRGGRYPKTDTYVYDFAGNRTATSDGALGSLTYHANNQ